jgi:hypothetical protein
MRSFETCTPPSIIRVIKLRRMRWAGHGEKGNAYRIFVGKSEGERQLGSTRHTWKDNIKVYLRETGCGGMDWIDLAQDREGSCEHGNEPPGFLKMLASS